MTLEDAASCYPKRSKRRNVQTASVLNARSLHWASKTHTPLSKFVRSRFCPFRKALRSIGTDGKEARKRDFAPNLDEPPLLPPTSKLSVLKRCCYQEKVGTGIQNARLSMSTLVEAQQTWLLQLCTGLFGRAGFVRNLWKKRKIVGNITAQELLFVSSVFSPSKFSKTISKDSLILHVAVGAGCSQKC